MAHLISQDGLFCFLLLFVRCQGRFVCFKMYFLDSKTVRWQSTIIGFVGSSRPLVCFHRRHVCFQARLVCVEDLSWFHNDGLLASRQRQSVCDQGRSVFFKDNNRFAFKDGSFAFKNGSFSLTAGLLASKYGFKDDRFASKPVRSQ